MTSILYCTFYKCTNLVSVNIPDTVTTIGQSAFHTCPKLKQLIPPEGVTSFGTYAVYGCTALETLYIPSTVTTINKGAFYGVKNLTIYYNGTAAEWNAITKGEIAIPTTAKIIYNSEIKDGSLYTYTFDASGNKTSTTVTMLDSTSIISAYTYDVNGNITSITDSRGNKESYVYDSNGNMLKYTDISGRVTEHTYDSKGSVLTEKNPKNVVTTYTYYPNGLLHTMSSEGITVTYTYDKGQVSTITQTGAGYSQTYTYTYNVYGNLLSVAVGNKTLVTYTYGRGGVGNVTSMTYANGYSESYTYDVFGNLLTVNENGKPAYSYLYDISGNVLIATDHKQEQKDVYLYGADGFSAAVVTYDKDGNVHTLANGDGTVRLPDSSIYYGLPQSASFENVGVDGYSRTTRKALMLNYTADNKVQVYAISYMYANAANNTCAIDQIFSEGFSNGKTYTYQYDLLGNLTSVSENSILIYKYTYDNLSQLIREDNFQTGHSYTWTYDKGGNITEKKTYTATTGTLGAAADTVTYTCGDSDWKDNLTNYNGIDISYDESGNPVNWRNSDSMTWNGRRLTGMDVKENGQKLSFTYNSDGLRTSKTVDGKTVQYVWDDGNLISEIHDDYALNFYYNGGEIVGFNYRNPTTISADYYFGKDIFGVIKYLYNTSGAIVGVYNYDAWGNVTQITDINGNAITDKNNISHINPIRYKDYYLDSETGFYYLQSRYYDSVVGRFINPDDLAYTVICSLISNTFTYCMNNSVNMADTNGEIGNYALEKLLGIGIVLTVAYKITAKIIAKKNYKYNKKQSKQKGMIHDQETINMKYGLYKVKDVGCGIVAVYKVLCFLGRVPDLASIVYDLDVKSYLYGALGASIFAMDSLLKSKGISTGLKLFPKSFDSYIMKKGHRMGIIAYCGYSSYGDFFAHYVFVSWNGTEFELYNNGTTTSAQKEPSVDSYMKSKNYKYMGIIYF